MTMLNAYRDEFETRVQQATAGMPPAERLRILRQWLTDYTREGRVPLPDGGWVSGVTSDRHAPARPSRVQTTPTRSPIQMLGIAVAILFMCGPAVWIFGLRDGSAAVADVLSQPVTAADGATAPIALTLADTTLPVRRFAPQDGWPNPAATADTVLWGGTTINQVFAIDGRTHQALLTTLDTGTVLTLRRADGTTTRYRVTTLVPIAPTEVEYAAQDRVGITVIAFGRGTERLAIQAVPADLPVTDTALAGGRVRLGTAAWTVKDGQPALTVDVVSTGARETDVTIMRDGVPVETLPAASTPHDHHHHRACAGGGRSAGADASGRRCNDEARYAAAARAACGRALESCDTHPRWRCAG